MKLLVTGPESSGTSLVSRILRSAGAGVFHRSATYDGDWPDMSELARRCDAVVVVWRDPVATHRSQVRQGLSEHEASAKLRQGYLNIGKLLAHTPIPVLCLTYEQLVLDVQSIRPTLDALGLDQPDEFEQVRNANAKYGYWRVAGGPRPRLALRE